MRLIDADKIVYMWKQDINGNFHDGVTLESIVGKTPTENVNALIAKELEEVWEEIRALPDINPDYPMDKTIHISRYEVQKIVYERISELKEEKKYETEVITRGNCMMCGKELTEGLFFCKECEEKANSRK